MIQKKDLSKSFLKLFIIILAPLFVGFIGWLFNVDRSITAIKVNQVYLVESITEMKTNIRDIRKTVEEALGRTAKEKQGGNNCYASEN